MEINNGEARTRKQEMNLLNYIACSSFGKNPNLRS